MTWRSVADTKAGLAPTLIHVYQDSVLIGYESPVRAQTGLRGAMGKVGCVAAVLVSVVAGSAHGGWAGPLTPVIRSGAFGRKALIQPVLLRSEIDKSLSKMSAGGQFKVSVSPRPQPIPMNRMHQWILSVARPDGHPIDNAKVEISGDALGRNRQLPTAPRVTRNLGGGQYLIEGVRFNMAGWWELKLRLESGQHRDNVTFNIEIK